MAIGSGDLLLGVAENPTFPILSALAYTTCLGYRPTCDFPLRRFSRFAECLELFIIGQSYDIVTYIRSFKQRLFWKQLAGTHQPLTPKKKNSEYLGLLGKVFSICSKSGFDLRQ